MQGNSDRRCEWVREEKPGRNAWIGRGRDPSIPRVWGSTRGAHRRKMASMLSFNFRLNMVVITTFQSQWSYLRRRRPRVGDTPKPLQKKSPRLPADLSKRTFSFTKICTSFPLATSCPESAGQSVCLQYPTRPIFRFGTRPSTDRAVRLLPRRYGICPEGRAFVVLISASQYRSGSILRAAIICTAFARNGSEDFRRFGAS